MPSERPSKPKYSTRSVPYRKDITQPSEASTTNRMHHRDPDPSNGHNSTQPYLESTEYPNRLSDLERQSGTAQQQIIPTTQAPGGEEQHYQTNQYYGDRSSNQPINLNHNANPIVEDFQHPPNLREENNVYEDPNTQSYGGYAYNAIVSRLPARLTKKSPKERELDPQTKIEKLEREVSILKRAKETASAARDDISQKWALLDRKYNSLQRDYAIIYHENKHLRTENEQHQAKIRSQKNEYEIKLDKIQRSVDSHVNHINDIENKHGSYNSLLAPEKSDSDWQAAFETLRESVQTLASSMSKTFPKSFEKAPSNITEEIEREIRMVCLTPGLSLDEIFSRMKGGKKQRQFFQGWVHLTLWKMVFSPNIPAKWAMFKKSGGGGGGRQYVSLPGLETQSTGQDLWLDSKTAQALKHLEIGMANYVTPNGKSHCDGEMAFHKWRCLTLSMLQTVPSTVQVHDSVLEKIRERCLQMAGIVHELQGSVCDTKEELERLTSRLMKIFEKAIIISSELRAQKAAYDVRFPTPYSPQSLDGDSNPPISEKPQEVLLFDPTWMKAESQPSSSIQYVVEPAVIKSGNSNGEDYDIAGPFMKATVTCYNPSAAKSSHMPKPINSNSWEATDRQDSWVAEYDKGRDTEQNHLTREPQKKGANDGELSTNVFDYQEQTDTKYRSEAVFHQRDHWQSP